MIKISQNTNATVEAPPTPVTKADEQSHHDRPSGAREPSKPSETLQPTLGVKFVSAGLAACFADMVTFPLDTAKVRLQVQGEGTVAAIGAQLKYRGVFGTVATICREEGVRGCYSGLAAGLQRQMAFASIRIGLYDAVKQTYLDLFKVDGSVGANNVGLRILAGITTGGLAVSFAQPTDVVKVRMQAAGAGPKRYTGCMNAYRTIATEEGIRGLWKGTLPNITRNAIVNAAELVSYDLIKESILKHNLLSDNMPCHFVSAFGAGFCTTVVASPVDVVKTRFMNSAPGLYSGAADCAIRMYKEKGFQTFYKGFMPSFMRLGSWNVVMFVTFEQLKRGISRLSQSDTISPPTIAIANATSKV